MVVVSSFLFHLLLALILFEPKKPLHVFASSCGLHLLKLVIVFVLLQHFQKLCNVFKVLRAHNSVVIGSSKMTLNSCYYTILCLSTIIVSYVLHVIGINYNVRSHAGAEHYTGGGHVPPPQIFLHFPSYFF